MSFGQKKIRLFQPFEKPIDFKEIDVLNKAAAIIFKKNAYTPVSVVNLLPHVRILTQILTHRSKEYCYISRMYKIFKWHA